MRQPSPDRRGAGRESPSPEGLLVGQRRESDGTIYAGTSIITGDNGQDYTFDLYTPSEDLRGPDGHAMVDTWAGATTRLPTLRTYFGHPGSAITTESQLTRIPEAYDGGWMLPTEAELAALFDLRDSGCLEGSFVTNACSGFGHSYWSCTTRPYYDWSCAEQPYHASLVHFRRFSSGTTGWAHSHHGAFSARLVRRELRLDA